MVKKRFVSARTDAYYFNILETELENLLHPKIKCCNQDKNSGEMQKPPSPIDPESADTTNFLKLFDEAIKTLPHEMRQWLPVSFDFGPYHSVTRESSVIPDTKEEDTGESKGIEIIESEERENKLEKFLERKKIRTFNRKVLYFCRKKVADQRIRIKGRFVSKELANVIVEDRISKE